MKYCKFVPKLGITSIRELDSSIEEIVSINSSGNNYYLFPYEGNEVIASFIEDLYSDLFHNLSLNDSKMSIIQNRLDVKCITLIKKLINSYKDDTTKP